MSTIKLTTRTDQSWFTYIVQRLLRLFGGPSLIAPKFDAPAGSPKLEISAKIRKKCNVRERQVEDVYVYDFTPRSNVTSRTSPKQIYYFPGGGFVGPAGPPHISICAELATKLDNTTVSLVSYPLAPNSPAPTTVPQLLKLYHALLAESAAAKEKVVFVGDSAGGNLCLTLPLTALNQDTHARCPASIMLISPCVDPRNDHPKTLEIEKAGVDPLLSIAFADGCSGKWRGEWSLSDPRLSALDADLSVLKRRGIRVHGVYGHYDILSPNVTVFKDKCNSLGISGEWLEWDKQMHIFPLFWELGLSEAVTAKDWILAVLDRE